jgi:membrane protein YdbS with pleckstrin-like domain
LDDPDAPLPLPTRRLPDSARAYWALSTALGAIVPLAAAIAVGVAVGGVLAWVLPLLVVVSALAAVLVVPRLRYQRWRYEVRDEEIDIQHGTFVVRRTLVPIRRVQHVETETGPLQGRFGLSSVAFHTAAGETEIPALALGEADRVRARIARLARGLDDV